MQFNICIIQPANYVYSLAFVDVAELVHFSLIELGHESRITLNHIEPHSINIIIGVHLLGIEVIEQIPKNSIIINTEQLYAIDKDWNASILKWIENFQTWDYSQRNIENLAKNGYGHIKKLDFGYQNELNRISPQESQDIDVLFYGGVNERRDKILKQIQGMGMKLTVVSNKYGKERDALTSRSKIVLNMHYYEAEIFEVVRVFFLLTNSKAVVGEVNPTTSIEPNYRAGIQAAPYEGLAKNCLELIDNEQNRKNLEIQALGAIKDISQAQITAALLG